MAESFQEIIPVEVIKNIFLRTIPSEMMGCRASRAPTRASRGISFCYRTGFEFESNIRQTFLKFPGLFRNGGLVGPISVDPWCIFSRRQQSKAIWPAGRNPVLPHCGGEATDRGALLAIASWRSC